MIPNITVAHFKTIAIASLQFENYLKVVHLGDESKNAAKQHLRADRVLTTQPSLGVSTFSIRSKKRSVTVESDESDSDHVSSDESATESDADDATAESEVEVHSAQESDFEPEARTKKQSRSKHKIRDVATAEDRGMKINKRGQSLKKADTEGDAKTRKKKGVRS